MAMQAIHAGATRNRLLAALPPAALALIWPSLERVELVNRVILGTPGQPIPAVHFPESGYISMVVAMEDGDVAEVGLIGRDGMVGMPVLLGSDHDDLEAMVQCGGTALRLDAEVFRGALADIPALRPLLLRYVLELHGQVARTAACNGRHQTEQRLARWLLMAHDRAEGDHFPITHEFLGMMLGLRRAGVTVAAGALQRAGFIHYDRGRLEVTDRAGLESASCECYRVVRRSAEGTFPTPGA